MHFFMYAILGSKKKPGKHTHSETLSSNKIGMKKRLRKLKHQGQPQNQRATAKDRVIKSAIGKISVIKSRVSKLIWSQEPTALQATKPRAHSNHSHAHCLAHNPKQIAMSIS